MPSETAEAVMLLVPARYTSPFARRWPLPAMRKVPAELLYEKVAKPRRSSKANN